ncbi:uncharacterized protein LOC119639000 isoform X2 [Glossina fuscipes]|uniref:Uncharacterized protein LOC119639000 isoform X2 n=1 Tax=Glossina fuscipes TaxID=7396 RepID=A0A9C5Z922_9MUSC|nr:uncharacterized protein LOC119639000 isoform X2 [Glossina fuscipes]
MVMPGLPLSSIHVLLLVKLRMDHNAPQLWCYCGLLSSGQQVPVAAPQQFAWIYTLYATNRKERTLESPRTKTSLHFKVGKADL